MDASFFIRGIVLGFSIAAPVGPIGVLCIRRTIANGRASGFVSGLGAATADAIYGTVAGFGLTWVSNVLVSQQRWMQLVGGAFLCYLGIKTLVARPSMNAARAREGGLMSDYLTALLLTVTNPATILSFAAVFAGLGLASTGGSYSSAALVVAGVLIGSAAWWLLLSGTVGIFRHKFDERRLAWVNRISGATITAMGVLCLVASK